MVIPSHHDLARDPYAIERIVQVDLPEIVEVESEDNSDRGASRWDVYTHRVQFGGPLSEESVEKMEYSAVMIACISERAMRKYVTYILLREG